MKGFFAALPVGATKSTEELRLQKMLVSKKLLSVPAVPVKARKKGLFSMFKREKAMSFKNFSLMIIQGINVR